ncbi:hypothetical protein [Streptomyces camelliae]|uniref:Uncharacterized protein n=1 Tax=Streptomyces camelliae TaxID=3004093 RepID=A0ABY7NTZ6_9ACTN|nr:hypothetical protein [Streptomyces sp. HUAS 2-6]WBO61701.1 hypothetical protein O1G22_01935 [Streptomyces sp. HUAS 2-6]
MIADNHKGGPGLVRCRATQHREPHRERLTLHVSDLTPGEGVLMPTYCSDGQEIATSAPFTEIRTTAQPRGDLLNALWSALPPQLRVAAALFAPGDLLSADIRQTSPTRIWSSSGVESRGSAPEKPVSRIRS